MGIKKRIFRNFINIVPVEETFFISAPIPKIINITKQIIALNFSHLSPYQNGDFIFYLDKENKRLYLWFTENNLPQKKVSIPEGFLFFKKAKKNKDIILIIKKENVVVFLSIKNSSLTSQIVKKTADINKIVSLLKKRENMTDPEIMYVKSANPEEIGLMDMLKFLNLSFIDILKTIGEFLKLPTIAFLMALNIWTYAYYTHLNKTLEEKEKILNGLKLRTLGIKEKYIKLEEQKSLWKSFIKQELKYPEAYKVYTTIYKIVTEHNGNVLIYNQHQNLIKITVISNSSSSIAEKLMNTGLFSNVKILSIYQYRSESEKAKLELYLNSKRQI